MKSHKITVYGAGYVGLVTAVCLAEIGHQVICLDVDADKIAVLQQGSVPFYEPGLAKLLIKNQQHGRLVFTTDLQVAARFAVMHMIAVGTPAQADGRADLSYVWQVVEQLAKQATDNMVIITKSTVPVGTAEQIYQLFIQHAAHDIVFNVVSNPEFLREGHAVEDFMAAARIIIGSHDQHAIALLTELYQPLIERGVPLVTMDPASAELTKYAANAMLATKISFINEMSHLAELTGADIEQVARAMSYDKRIGPHFIAAGCGYGGSCFPKDLTALAALADTYHYETQIINAVIAVNQRQKNWLFDRLQQYYQTQLAQKTLAIWGLAFKPETDDLREASSIVLINELSKLGTKLQVYDPVAMDNARHIFNDTPHIQFAATADEALVNADGLVIVTEWQEFKDADLSCVRAHVSVIFDGRNIYPLTTMRALDFEYISIGRPATP